MQCLYFPSKGIDIRHKCCETDLPGSLSDTGSTSRAAQRPANGSTKQVRIRLGTGGKVKPRPHGDCSTAAQPSNRIRGQEKHKVRRR